MSIAHFKLYGYFENVNIHTAFRVYFIKSLYPLKNEGFKYLYTIHQYLFLDKLRLPSFFYIFLKNLFSHLVVYIE